MRLFVGIPLPESTHQTLSAVQDELKPFIKRGRLTDHTLFHVTLLFIGEVDANQISILTSHLKNGLQTFHPFQLNLASLGTFDRGIESVLWIGIQQPPKILDELSKTIQQIVKNLKLEPSDQPFRPHITLGRQIVLINHGDHHRVHVPSISFEVNRIHLYLSHQVDGKLTYTPLDTYHLI